MKTTHKPLTTAQIRARLKKLPVFPHCKISRGEVEVIVRDAEGDLDYDATDAASSEVLAALPGWGGYRAGYGAFVFSPEYVSNGDFMDRGSRWHY